MCSLLRSAGKIIPALQSRCTRFRFGPLSEAQMRGRLEEIAAIEKVALTRDGADALLRLSAGDMRRVLNVLQVRFPAVRLTSACCAQQPPMTWLLSTPAGAWPQATSMSYDEVNEASVYMCCGQPLPKGASAALSACNPFSPATHIP